MSWQIRHIRWFVLGSIVALAVSSAAFAQKGTPTERERRLSGAADELSSGKPPAALTLEAIMDSAVKNISKRYGLNEAQREMTDRLLKGEVQRFLKEHENEVWPVIGDLLRSRLGLEPPSPEDARRIGRAARPLLTAAREYILRGNEEWRAILTEEQRRVHDFDMSDIERQFAEMDDNFQAWEEGNPGDRLFPSKNPKERDVPRPQVPPDVVPTYTLFDPNPILETIVEEFIKEHDLSKGQVTAARSILEEFKGQANDYKNAKKNELTAVAAERHKAVQARDAAAVKAAEIKHKQLLRPIYALCDAMTDRLTKQLTTAQMQRHAGETDKNATPARPEPTPPSSLDEGDDGSR